MDVVVVLLVVCVVVFCFKRTFSGFIYAVGASEILFRLLSFLRVRLFSSDIANFIAKYFPENIPAVISKYTEGIIYEVLIWIFVGIMIIFEFYTIRIFLKKR